MSCLLTPPVDLVLNFFLLSLRGEFNADKRCEIKFAKLSFGRRYRNCQDRIRSGRVRERQTKEMFYELGCWQPLELWQRRNGEKRLGQPGEKPDNTSVHQCPKHEILGRIGNTAQTRPQIRTFLWKINIPSINFPLGDVI